MLAIAGTAWAGPVKSGVYDFAKTGGKVDLHVTVAASGKKIDIFFLDLPTSCRIGKLRPHYPTSFSPRPDMKIKAGGRFGYSEVIRGPRPGAIQKWQVSGRFSGDGRSVTVTGRYTLRRPDGSCDTKRRTATAVLTRLFKPGPFTGPYAGRTTAGEPITFTVERGRLTNVKTRATLTCDDRTTVVRDIAIAEVKTDAYGFDTDLIRGDFDDPFKVVGSIHPKEPMAPTAEDPDPGFCVADESFTATPTRPLDS